MSIVSQSAVPPFYRIPFVWQGYRTPLWAKDCINSVFPYIPVIHKNGTLHNETLNIHTHLAPAVIFFFEALYAFFVTLPNRNPNWTLEEQLIWLIFFSTTMLCFFFSAVYHTFNCHKRTSMVHNMSRLDYCGITLLIGGFNVTSFYFGFECFPSWRLFYLLVSVALLFGGLFLYLCGRYFLPEYRKTRLRVFVLSGCLGVLPTIQWAFISTDKDHTVVQDIFTLYLLFGVGFFFYLSNIPERFVTNKKSNLSWFVSHFAHSHIWWHILTAISAQWHLATVLNFREYRLNNPCSEVV